MDPETKDILKETLKLSKENNKMLRGMRSSMRWSTAIKSIYWIVIIGSMFGFYYYFQPLINDLTSIFDKLISGVGKVQNIGSSFHNIGSILNK